MSSKFKKKNEFNPMQILAIGFAILILIGTILLSLPISTARNIRTPILDCFFTATSAVCVTGLVVVDTGTYWSHFGQTIIMLLIETGGLGFMSFAVLFSLILGKKITFKERLIMHEAMNTNSLGGLVKLTRYILVFTFSIEIVGAILLSFKFIPIYGVETGIYYSVFHSISAFCNAGFDLFGGYRSLTIFSDSAIVILTISAIVIIAGLGFSVWSEIYTHRKLKKFSLHAKLVLSMTLFLFVFGTIMFFILEYNNPGTIKNMTLKGKILSSVFASVTPRTAGLNSISVRDMTPGGKFLTVLYMFIGGSPGSTAGGIKTTTIGVLLLTVVSVIHGRSDTEVFKTRISKEIVYRAFAITVIGLFIIIFDVLILSITEVGAELTEILFEVVSAFATVGLSMGLTGKLTPIGKIVIMITMYAGRVGPLTLALALAKNNNSSGVKYPEEKILVG
ncbi:MAG: TrkH family potassium uptake protein [Clostridiaceae bacterium]